MIWMGALLVSDVDTWLPSVMVTISPFAAGLAIVVVERFDCELVALIWLLGVIVTKFRCSASWVAISPSFPLYRMGTRLISFFFVFVSVFIFVSIKQVSKLCGFQTTDQLLIQREYEFFSPKFLMVFSLTL